MKFATVVPENKILTTAMNLVQSAQKEIFVTMNIDEEIISPLPKKYHQALEAKIVNGVMIVRYGYGQKKFFTEIKKKYPIIEFVYKGQLKNYQRMLIVDNKRALFRLHSSVYYTEFVLLVEALQCFAEKDNICMK